MTSILIVNSGALPKGREKTEEKLRDMETINYTLIRRK
jgi:hypothetical protein